MINRPWHEHLYAVVTPNAVGIFTTYSEVEPLIKGCSNKHKKFIRYCDAEDFIKSSLTDEDQAAFGILNKGLCFDKAYKRYPYKNTKKKKPKYRYIISEKEDK